MTMTRTTTFFALCLLLPLGDAVAQMGGDPAREIQEIAEAVDAQLKEIDRLLLESGKKAQERARPKELLKDVIERNRTVDDGLQKLIEKLEEMKNQSSSSSSSSGSQGEQQGQGQQSQGQQGQPQGGQNKPQGNRRENNNPDFVDQTGEGEGQGEQPKPGEQQQPGEQPGEQQGQPQGGKPQGGDPSQAQGENVPGAPQQSETGPGQRGEGEGQWGELQPYLNFLKNRGTSPKVPAKFRKYYEAYLKRKAGDKK